LVYNELTEIARALKYLVIISGDGNFHFHSMARVKGMDLDPSVYGSNGFWVPPDLAAKYISAAENINSFKDVSCFTLIIITSSLQSGWWNMRYSSWNTVS
jgi:hypothetical protein